MLQADMALFQGRYRAALSSGFVQHGSLAPGAAASLAEAGEPAMAAADIHEGGLAVAPPTRRKATRSRRKAPRRCRPAR